MTIKDRLRQIAFAAVLLAALSAVSCTDPSADGPATQGAKALSVRAASKARTKGYVEGTALQDTGFDRLHDGAPTEPRTMRLTAWLHPAAGPETEYFRNEPFACNANGEADGLWHHNPKLYWPMGGTLDFLGYSTTLPFPEDAVTWGRGVSTESVTLTVDESYLQDDILYAYVGGRTSGNEDGHVPMLFEHGQAWIQLRVRATQSGVATLHGVALEDVYRDGRLTVTHPYGTAQAAWDFRFNARRDLLLDDGGAVYGTPLETETRYLDVLIPEQDMKTIVLRYSLRGGDLVMEYAYDLPHATWQMGRRYVYDITFSPSEIRIVPSVLDWDTVSDDWIKGTGTATDAVGGAFSFRGAAKYLWRPTSAEPYREMEYRSGVWGDRVQFTCGDYVVTLRKDGDTYLWSYHGDYSQEPLTITVTEPGTLYWKSGTASFDISPIEFSLNGGAWTEIVSTSSGTPMDLSAGDVVRFRGNNNRYYDSGTKWHCFADDGIIRFDVSGNAMSLINAEGYAALTSLPDRSTFRQLFHECSVVDASGLVLPATSLRNDCYYEMFRGCMSLTTPPAELPAEDIPNAAYGYMFCDCTALLSAPTMVEDATVAANGYYSMYEGCTALNDNIPARLAGTAAINAYRYMFYGCTALTTAPDIESPSCSQSMCYGMFYGCTSLTEPPAITFTNVGQDGMTAMFRYSGVTRAPKMTVAAANQVSFNAMFANCTALEDATDMKFTATSFPNSCCNQMFYGCTALTAIPEITIAATASSCCAQMFSGCTSLADASAITVTASSFAGDCFNRMFSGCTALVTAPSATASAVTAGSGCCQAMFQGCTSLTEPFCPAFTTAATNCCYQMYYGCRTMEDVSSMRLMATELQTNCYCYMFYGCTALERGPEGPSFVTAGSGCCQAMFQGCTSLTDPYAPDFTSAATNCCNQMFYGCSSLAEAMSDLSAPATANSSYQRMFRGCTSLTAAPDLHFGTLAPQCCYEMFYGCSAMVTGPSSPITATDAASSCCQSMFYGCSSMTTAMPDIAVTTAAGNAFRCMFQGCTSLTAAPDLHLTTLGNVACFQMFQGCTSLTAAPDLPLSSVASQACYQMFQGCSAMVTGPSSPITAPSLGDSCFQEMFRGCSAMVSAMPDIAATTAANSAFRCMFQGCTSLTAAPDLHLTTLGTFTCYQMFQGCSAMVYGPTSMTATTTGNYCCYEMFKGCTSMVTALSSLGGASVSQNCFQGMFQGCTSLTVPPALPAATLAENCYREMFRGCYSLTAFPALPATTLGNYAYANMFLLDDPSRAVLETAPDLLAQTLAAGCYMQMFQGQRCLRSVRMTATSVSAQNALYDWLRNVAATGTIIKAASVSLPTGASGIPSGWTVINE